MLNPMTRRIFTLAAGFALAGLTSQGAAKVGEAAPDFTLKDTKGVEHTLAGLKGKYVVLEWLNHGCPYVAAQYNSGNMQKLQETWTAKGVVWISVNSAGPGKAPYTSPEKADQLTAEKKARPTAVALDPDGTVGHAFGAKSTPTVAVIDPAGKLIYFGAVDDNDSGNAEDAPKAKNYVSAALKAAMAGKPVETPVTKAYGCGIHYGK
ncbi:MAG: redoxin family protein [Kiritimatiellia bacterium]